MSVAVPPAAPIPANDAPCRIAYGVIQLMTCRVGKPLTFASELKEPENAMTKNIGMTMAGTMSAGRRRMRIMPRPVSARNTPMSWANGATR